MKLFCFHTPELTPSDNLPDCAIVLDILRATTTIATALSAGAEAVQVFKNIDDLMAASEDFPVEQRLRAGERGGKQVEGFELGNSPLSCTPETMAGKRLFLTTTNGTRALEKVQAAPILITAAQVNRQAVVNYLLATKPETVWMVGSGWQGDYSLEDTACAGAIAMALAKKTPISFGNDEAIGAMALYQTWEENLLSMFEQCSHGQRLLRLNNLDDLKYCATNDILDVVPIQTEPGVLKAL
jgi:2-phosphosulfolactate phosphatase